MGYLINPIGFRVGHTSSWIDTWFSYKDFYPEFLHFVLKIRVFLNFYLDSFPTEEDLDWSKKDINSLFRSAVLYSHFRIVFNLTSVYISLYLYPGKFWDSFNERFRSKIRSKSLFSNFVIRKVVDRFNTTNRRFPFKKKFFYRKKKFFFLNFKKKIYLHQLFLKKDLKIFFFLEIK